MKDEELYLRGYGPKRGCGCLIGGLLLLALLGFAIYWLFFRDKPEPDEASDPTPPPAEVDATTPAAPNATTAEEPAPPAGNNEAAVELLARAAQAFEDKKAHEARALARKALESAVDPATTRKAQDLLGKIHTLLVFTKLPMAEKERYTIKAGDTLGEIAQEFDTTVDLIMKSNNLASDRIRIGDNLRVLRGSFYVEVSKTRNELLVFLNEEFFKRYDVGTGEYASTPTGEFEINDRIEHPVWWRSDGSAIPYGHKDNLLGTHWLSLNIAGYGIHGTWENETIGRQSSAGCIRMRNEEVEELYILLPLKTPVEIIE